MISVIAQTASKYLRVFLWVLSFVLLFVGHNHPGGGFVGGLVAASGFILSILVFEEKITEQIMPITPRIFLAVGLLLTVVSGMVGMFSGKPFLTGVWFGSFFGTPLLFDIGVYCVVFGSLLMIMFALAEE